MIGFVKRTYIPAGLGDPQVFRFGNQNESARAFTRTRTLKEAAPVDHPLSQYVNSASFFWSWKGGPKAPFSCVYYSPLYIPLHPHESLQFAQTKVSEQIETDLTNKQERNQNK